MADRKSKGSSKLRIWAPGHGLEAEGGWAVFIAAVIAAIVVMAVK